MELTDQVKKFMKEKDLTQRQLAKRLNLSEAVFSRWLGGKQFFSVRTMEYIKLKLFLS